MANDHRPGRSTTYSDQIGAYVKIGSLVPVSGFVRLTAKDGSHAAERSA